MPSTNSPSAAAARAWCLRARSKSASSHVGELVGDPDAGQAVLVGLVVLEREPVLRPRPLADPPAHADVAGGVVAEPAALGQRRRRHRAEHHLGGVRVPLLVERDGDDGPDRVDRVGRASSRGGSTSAPDGHDAEQQRVLGEVPAERLRAGCRRPTAAAACGGRRRRARRRRPAPPPRRRSAGRAGRRRRRGRPRRSTRTQSVSARRVKRSACARRPRRGRRPCRSTAASRPRAGRRPPAAAGR